MAIPEMRLVLNFSFIGAIIAAAVYYYGKRISERKLDLEDKHGIYNTGILFMFIFVIFPLFFGLILSSIPVLALSERGIMFAEAVSVFLAGLLLHLMSNRLDGYKERDTREINKSREVLVIFGFATLLAVPPWLAFFAFGLYGGVAGMVAFLLFSTATADLYSQMKKDEGSVFIQTEDNEYYGTLFRVNENFHYLRNKAGVFVINNDKIEVLKDMSPLANQEGDVLIDSIGYHGGFNKVVRGRENFENIEKLRKGLANWMKNENFEDYKDKNIDVAIVYHYTDENQALDVDNLVKPVISSLENDERADDGEYLVEDDSQVRQILSKSMRAESLDEDYLTISFREHSEKPMKLVKRPVL